MRVIISIIKQPIACLLLLVSLSSYAQQTSNTRFFMQAGSKYSGPVPYGNNSDYGHYVESGDAKIYYEVYGEGKPVIVLHGGIVGSTKEMGQFIDSLSLKHKVIAISTRGHGKSEIGHSTPTYEQKADDLRAVLAKEGNEKALILGFSDGAYTGFFFAKRYPERLSGLIAIGAGEWKRGFRDYNMDEQALLSADSLYWKQQLTIRPEPQRTDEWFSMINRYYNSLQIDATVFLDVKCPVLLLAGERDQNAPLPTVLSAYKELPNAHLGIIPNASHAVFLENFSAVWACIVPFLTKIEN